MIPIHQAVAFFFLALDLNSVKTEPNLERRAYLALDNANQAIDRAKGHYGKASYSEAHAAVEEVRSKPGHIASRNVFSTDHGRTSDAAGNFRAPA